MGKPGICGSHWGAASPRRKVWLPGHTRPSLCKRRPTYPGVWPALGHVHLLPMRQGPSPGPAGGYLPGGQRRAVFYVLSFPRHPVPVLRIQSLSSLTKFCVAWRQGLCIIILLLPLLLPKLQLLEY